MPLPLNIDGLLHGKAVEWERLEFKEGWNPLRTLHTLCAFANDFHNLGGGYIVLGVAERDGQPVLPPVGLDAGQIDTIQKEILNLGHDAIQPMYHPIVVPYEIDGRHVLVLWASGGQTRPYKARLSLGKNDREYGYFIRKGSSTVHARGADETELLSLAATVPFDDRMNQRARVEDLSRDLMREYLVEVGSDLAAPAATLPLVDLGRQMNVVVGPAEFTLPLNVGLLFFSPEPHRFFPVTQIDVVWFPEGAGGDRFTEKVFQGPLPRIVREALDYIRRNYISETIIKHPDRAEATHVENFPYAAIEECVVNAIYHRGYDVREPVEVRIDRQELVVLSYPGPDRSVRLDELRAGRARPRRYRNRRIGEFLKELDFTEGRGTGIPKILRAMQENGSPPPEFDFDEDHSYFMVRLPVHPAVESAVTEVPPRPDLSVQVTEQVTEQVARFLGALGDETLSGRETQTRLDLSNRPSFLYTYLRPALAAGLIEMTVPGKPRSSLQKYRLSAKGRSWLLARREGPSTDSGAPKK
jgi:ATP-dependent DNA helicase RecG